jgi:hypothetical protein
MKLPALGTFAGFFLDDRGFEGVEGEGGGAAAIHNDPAGESPVNY